MNLQRLRFLLIIFILGSSFSPVNVSIKHSQALTVSSESSYITEFDYKLGDLYDTASLGDYLYITVYNSNTLWEFNTVNNQLRNISFGEDITPLLINRASDDSLWFLDYDYTPQEALDHVIRYVPSTGNITIIDLPSRAHAVNFGISNGYVLVSILNQDRVMMINTQSFETTLLNMTCSGYCGPGGADFDQNGNLWITDTLGNRFVKYSFDTQNYTFFPGIEKFRSPTYIKFDHNNTFWTGTHAGDKLANVNITDMSHTVYTSPMPHKGQYPTSGINDIDLLPNGDIWFAEHFINRVGRISMPTGTIHEYILPREEPLVALINGNGDKVWYAETYGIFDYFDLNKVPTVVISKISNQTINEEPNLSLDLEVAYQSGIEDNVDFSVFGEVKHFSGFGLSSDENSYSLKKGEKKTINIDISLSGQVDANTYNFVVGIKSDTFTASQQFYLTITQDWDIKGSFFSNFQWYQVIYIILPILFVLELYWYRKDIAKIITKITKKS